MPHPGQMLGDRYRLDDRIAAGGMGEVWQATDTVLGRDVAVKTLHAGRAGDPGFQNRFRHEARAMAVLHHPGVADVYDFGQTGEGVDAYIVMARVQGQPLNQWIAERGRLTPAETMSIVAQAGRALDAAHQAGIVHRDVKPSNLIVQPDGTVVLVDFGVARSAESAALTGAQEVVGTALYIAPEQVSKQTTGPPADMYALGALAYHCLSGHPPFLGPSPVAVALQHLHDEPPALPPEVPEPIRVLVATAMAKDPAQRFSSAAAMAEAADAARGLLTGSFDSTAALSATTPDLAAVTAPVSPGSAFGTATVPVAGSQTSVLPAPKADPPRPANRRRLIILAGLLLALAVIAAGLAFANLGDLLPGSPAPTTPAPASPAPSAKTRSVAPQVTGTTRSHRPTATTRAATTSAPAGGTGTRTTATPSRTPTATTTTAQAPTATTTTAAGGPTGTNAAAVPPELSQPQRKTPTSSLHEPVA